MGTLALNTLDLTPENGIYITKPPTFKTDSKYNVNSAWGGVEVEITNIQSRETKITLTGLCYTRDALRSLMSYSILNYNWNIDPEDIYLVENLVHKWKVKSMEVSSTMEFGDVYGFDIEIVTNTPPEGLESKEEEGTASGTTPISGFLNSGNKDCNFEYITITGVYSDSSNLTTAFITQQGTNYHIAIADVLLDTASITFYKDYTAYHLYEDDMSSGTLFERNCFSHTNTVFDTDRLEIPDNETLVYKFQLYHPLIQDPTLTLSIETLEGSPTIEVSSDGSSWWEIEKALVAKNSIKYELSHLAGSSDFYWRIRTGSHATVSSPTLATTATTATGGSLPDATTYYIAVAAGNSNGTAAPSNVLSQLTGSETDHTHTITVTIPQIIGATYYDIFLSTDAQPKKVGRVTEAQRAAAGTQILSYPTVTTGGDNATGTVEIGAVGVGDTGVLSSTSLDITYMKLESWHTYSGERPIPYLRAGTSETMTIDMVAGSCDYEFGYHDVWCY